MKIELIFKIVAVALLGAAAFFLWQGNRENAFAAAVLSACAYFLNMRFQLKAKVDQRKAAEEEEEELPE
jgi:Ca2+/H+ antiporter